MMNHVGPTETGRWVQRRFGMARTLARRWGFLAVAMVMLAVPATALAAIHYLSGPVGSGAGNAGVEIHFDARNGKPNEIKLFGFFNVPVSCQPSGSTAISGHFSGSIEVSSDKFSRTQKVDSGQTTYMVSGTFSGLNKAAGKLRIKGTVPGCLSGDTGSLSWHAHESP